MGRECEEEEQSDEEAEETKVPFRNNIERSRQNKTKKRPQRKKTKQKRRRKNVKRKDHLRVVRRYWSVAQPMRNRTAEKHRTENPFVSFCTGFYWVLSAGWPHSSASLFLAEFCRPAANERSRKRTQTVPNFATHPL